MATQPIDAPNVSVHEYLSTVYEPDVEYVDGRLEERNVGEHDHGYLQTLLATLFTNHRQEWNIRAVTDVRVQVAPSRFRVPDISVLSAGAPRDPILKFPPLIAIEILSPEDRLSRLQNRIDDYLAFGIEHIWIFDPQLRTARVADHFGMHVPPAGELSVPNTAIRIDVAALFAELDRA